MTKELSVDIMKFVVQWFNLLHL